MSSDVNGDRESSGSGVDSETNNETQNESLPPNPLRDEPNNEASASGNNNNSNRNEIPSHFFQLNPEQLPNVLQARNLLEGVSSRALSGVTRALQRSGSLFSPSVSSAVAAFDASSSFSPSNSSLTQNSLERRSPERMAEQEVLLRRITERIARDRRERRSEERAERMRESLARRRRRRSRDSSSENEESTSRRRRRAENVVESLGELMVVPTSSTLGENAEGETPRSDANVDSSTGNANAANANEDANQNGDGSNIQGAGPSNQPALEAVSNDGSRAPRMRLNDERSRTFQRLFRRHVDDRNRMEASSRGSAGGNDEGNDSDDDSINIDSVLAMDAGLSFDLESLVDRDQILNNLMERSILQRSIRRLRDIESEAFAAQRSTDLKCPVCNEIFVDYEASQHPNAPGNRSGSTRCSHGALTLFTKLHQCPICFDDDIEPPNVVALACGHVVCKEDFCKLGGHVGTERPAGCPKPKPVP